MENAIENTKNYLPLLIYSISHPHQLFLKPFKSLKKPVVSQKLKLLPLGSTVVTVQIFAQNNALVKPFAVNHWSGMDFKASANGRAVGQGTQAPPCGTDCEEAGADSDPN